MSGSAGLDNVDVRPAAPGASSNTQSRALPKPPTHAHPKCILWHACIEGQQGWEHNLDPEAHPFRWSIVFHDEQAAQLVLPLELNAGESYLNAFSRSRDRADHRRAYQTSAKAFHRGESCYSQDYRCYDKHGEMHWIHEDVSLEPAGYGKWKAVGVCTNVSEHKAAEQALRASEERFSLFMRHLPGLAFTKDSVGRVTFINENHKRVMGWDEDQWNSKTVHELYPPAIADVMDAHDREVLQSGQPLQAIEVIPHSDGDHTYIVSKFPIVDPGSGSAVLGGICFDITPRVQAQERLRYQKTLLESVIEATRDGVLVVGEDGKWLSFNRRFAQLWRIPDEIVASRSDEQALQFVQGMLRDPEEFLRRVQHLYDNPGETARDRIELRDGRVFERHTLPVIGPDGTRYGRVWFFHDATEEEQARERLRSLAWEATKSEERERRRIASTLHDHVGQMLTAMKMKLDEHVVAGSPVEPSRLEEFQGLVDDILSATRDLTIELSPPVLYQFGLYAALHWLGTTMLQPNRIRFDCRIEAEPLIDDETRLILFRAVRELLHNVVKHARAKSVQVRAWEEQGSLRIAVEDDGVGIGVDSPAPAAAVFDRSNSFGLFSIRERLKSLGGSVVIESNRAEGTRATLIVPIEGKIGS